MKPLLIAAAFAVGACAGRAHERSRPFGTAFWRAEAQLALHIHDEARLAQLQQLVPERRGVAVLEYALRAVARLIEPHKPRK